MDYSLGWVVLLFCFAVLEVFAIADRSPGDTFSEHIWRWAGVRGTSTSHKLRRGLLAAFLVWLTLHLVGVIP